MSIICCFGVLISSFSTSLSAFSINNSSTVKDDFEKIRLFSEKVFVFQVQDKVNSVLALLEDCFKANTLCSELCDNLQVLETYDKHKGKAKVRSVLVKFGSVEGLLKQCSSRIESFGEKLDETKIMLQEIQTVIDSDELVCFKCQGKGYTNKTNYVRERGQPPQPYT